jgi:streptomycin 6-kinase
MGRGAVEVFDTWSDDRTAALLLERCVPGTTLKACMAPEEQDVVVAGLLRRLWTARTDGPFRSLDAMCEAWADEADRRALPPSADPGHWHAARAAYRALPATAPGRALLATDLHEENVLAAEREPWLVIDVKPHVGDPHYDVLQHVLNHEERMRADPLGTVDRMAELCDVDRDRTRLWLVARCSVEPTWPLAAELIESLVPILL